MDETINLALNPSIIFAIMSELYNWGTWGLFGIPVNGVILVLIWIAEFFIIAALAIKTSHKISKIPFCELSNKWFKEEKIGPFTYVYDRPNLISKIQNSEPTAFEHMEFTQNDKRDHTLFKIYDNNQGKIYLTAESHKARIKDGKLEFDITPFVQTILITANMKQNLLIKTGQLS
jgi:hypothetical protein